MGRTERRTLRTISKGALYFAKQGLALKEHDESSASFKNNTELTFELIEKFNSKF